MKKVNDNPRCKQYFIENETKIYFNSDFDNGNLQKVENLSPYVYKLIPRLDKQKNSTSKTFFHFKVFGFQLCTVKFQITRVQILEKLLKKNQTDTYRPVVRKGNGAFERLKEPVQIYYNKQDDIELSFIYQFGQGIEWHEFAFSYPYSYQQCQDMIADLRQAYRDHSEIYFHDQILGFTSENRQVNLITISEKINCEKIRQSHIDSLFPQETLRPFKIKKPKVIISARVHPGESPASYCLEGLIQFLLNEKDYRSYLLRKNFHFIIIPMLNPDGVYHGLFRTDLNGDNLNRFYENCSQTRQTPIWLFKRYLLQMKKCNENVAFYYDFHAHPSKKQFFIYGNAFNEFTYQVQAETFGKILEENCPFFHNVDSIFNQKQMKAKDRFDPFSKQGCARVYVHRLFDIIHSYTVECGYYSPGKLRKLYDINQNLIGSGQYRYTDDWQACNPRYYLPQSYKLMGKSIIISILDLFHLNPYSRINSNIYRSINNMRKIVSSQIFSNTQRFRIMDPCVNKKMKQLTEIIEEAYYKPKFGDYGISVSENHHLKFKRKNHSMDAKVYRPRQVLVKQQQSKEISVRQMDERIYSEENLSVRESANQAFRNSERLDHFLSAKTEVDGDISKKLVSLKIKEKLNSHKKQQESNREGLVANKQQIRYISSDKAFKYMQGSSNNKKGMQKVRQAKQANKLVNDKTSSNKLVKISLFLKKSTSKRPIQSSLSIPKNGNSQVKTITKLSENSHKKFLFPNLKIG